eukprot:3406392-Pleurochrysis_carterae.AAC.2
MLSVSELARTSTGEGPQKKQQVERIKNARDNNAKRLQVANLPICSAVATGHVGEQIIDVNAIGVNFALINAVKAAVGDRAEDQGEQTDPSLDYAVSTDTNMAAEEASSAQPTSPVARATAQLGEATPSFQIPTISNAPTTDIPRARSSDELAITTDLEADTPITNFRQTPCQNPGT